MTRASLVKITRPRYSDVFKRERLFPLLGDPHNRVVWIAAPAGAGKTTLASSYLAASEVPHLWYQLDAGDADLPTFFHYLGLGARAAASPEIALPHLTSEYLAGLQAFARRYFEALAAQLEPPFVLVFDNYQDVSPDSPVHSILMEGIRALPRGFRTLVLSRTPPPPALASAGLALLGWEQLQLSPEEVEGIERLGQRKRRVAAQGKTSRWAAGLVLMLEQRGAARPVDASPESDPQLLFDHFAGGIFAQLDERRQRVLLASALLPKMTAPMLAKLTASGTAGELLEELHRKNYFTLKHAEPAYEYHPLFRDFLLRQAKSTLPAAELRALRREAAALAEADGQLEAAAELLRACGDFDGVAQLVLVHAQPLLQQGRGQVLEGWLANLPAELRAAQPWLSYWHGLCRLPFSPEQARGHFEAAFAAFREDPGGRCLAWCAIVDSYVYEWGNFQPLRRWLAAMEDWLATQPALPDEIEAQVACGMFLAMMYAQPAHPQMARWEARAREIILQGSHPALQVKVGNSLLIYHTWWTGELDKAELLVRTLRAQVERPGMPPLLRITWDAMAAGFYWMSAANADCIACVEHGLETGRTNGVHTWDRLLCSQGVFGTLSAGDRDGARRYFERMEFSAAMSRPMDHGMYDYLSAWYRLAEDDLTGALDFARKAVDMAEAAGAVFPAAVMRNDLGRVLCRLGEKEHGLSLIRRSRTEGRSMGARTIEYLTLMAEAEVALDADDEAACVESLRRGLAVAAAQGFVNHTWWSAELMSRLYSVALAHGIEPEFVAAQIRRRGLSISGTGLAARAAPASSSGRASTESAPSAE